MTKPSTGNVPNWNVLTTPWMEAVTLRSKATLVSPLDAVANAEKLHRIVSENPLDVFAAHRFLLTLFYWVAGDTKSVTVIRRKLLRGEIPSLLVRKLKAAAGQFNLFDRKAPFLQDPSVVTAKRSPPAYLFAEMASGTNVAHFHHGDDGSSQLCLRCATLGLLRVVPWMQSGGAGLSPAIHGAPPIMPLAVGKTLCETLGLNLIPIDLAHGKAQWTGHFRPTASRVRLMEGLTWNARRIHLLEPHEPNRCSRCGETSLPTVGPIAFEKNDACKKDPKRVWRDPSAFYSLKNGMPFATVKSGRESNAAVGGDLRNLFERKYGKKAEPAPSSLVVEANPTHDLWYLVVPCTNPANNKSFDHRAVWLERLKGDPPVADSSWPKDVVTEAGDPKALQQPGGISASKGTLAFVRAASTLTAADWAVLGLARAMDESTAAFDVFTSVYWPLRERYASLPCRPAAWLALKLMAAAGRFRPSASQPRSASFQPWSKLELHQPPATTRSGRTRLYPRAVPTGDPLETELHRIIRQYISSRNASAIDWPGTCQFLHDVLS